MTSFDSKVWLIAKIFGYVGAILVAMNAVFIGLVNLEPPVILFDAAMVAMGIGVVLGSYVAIRTMKKQ